MPDSKVKLAVVTGGHPFDVVNFQHVFRDMASVDFYPQGLDDFTFFRDSVDQYDVILFYTMPWFKPGDERPWYEQNVLSTLESLGRRDQGLVLLHHTLVAFPQWDVWTEFTGLSDRRAKDHAGQMVPVHVEKAHPITAGVADWVLADETYEMGGVSGGDNDILLTTDHPLSMKTLAWTRHYRESRVFCYQSGHNVDSFEDRNFRRVLEQGILWAARRI